MLGAFWEGLSGKLADKLTALAVPALLFWLGGLLAWIYHRGGPAHLQSMARWLTRESAITQLVIVFAAVVAVAGSALTVKRLTLPVLRLLEGYWPRWCSKLRRRLVARVERQAAADREEWHRLAPSIQASEVDVTPEQLAAFIRVDQRIRRRPSLANRYMPTRIGNILRAAETWPRDKYSLDAVVIWPRLWLLLPDSTRDGLVTARTALDNSVAAVIWGLLFCVFTIWTPLVIPVGLAVAIAAVIFWVPDRAEVFGDLVESAYDLYRGALYRQVRWPLPSDPEQEHSAGKDLTTYLSRGSDSPDPVFTPPPR